MNSHTIRTCAIILVVALFTATQIQEPAVATSHQIHRNDAMFGITLSSSSIVVKVGETVTVNVTLSNLEAPGEVCYSVAGFPETGFQVSFNPVCSKSNGRLASVLSVEATPAAAPQSFTALVIASYAGQTAQAPLSITVEPAMPVWVPWLGLGLFFLFLVAAVFWSPKLHLRKSRKQSAEK